MDYFLFKCRKKRI